MSPVIFAIRKCKNVIKTKAMTVGLAVITAVVMNVAIYWDMTPCISYMKQLAVRWLLALLILTL
jgi:hypothetical protein